MFTPKNTGRNTTNPFNRVNRHGNKTDRLNHIEEADFEDITDKEE